MQGLTQRQAQTLDFIRQSIEERGYPPTLREIGEFMGIRSTNGVNDHLRALERKGYLRREDMKSRALRLVRDHEPADVTVAAAAAAQATASLAAAALIGAPSSSVNGAGGSSPGLVQASARMGSTGVTAQESSDDDLLSVNILGRVAAGLPLLAEENIIDTVRVDRMMVRGGREVFGLRVQGDSMIEAGILNGDYIFVRKQSTADRGQIVVALIGEEATVKYYFPERDYIRFQPANSEMAPILVRATDFKPTMLLGVVVGVYRRL